MKSKVICLLAIGEKYQKQYQKLRNFFDDYASKCDADLIVFHDPIDKEFYRPLLSQKLLIPSQLLDYKIGAFLDLDIIISQKAPSIFEILPENKSFGAILDPRGTEIFDRAWEHIPRILTETTSDYFTERNFNNSDKLVGSINGGVFVFRPTAVASLFSDYYYSNHNQGILNSFEEAPMAYITQTNDMFEALDNRFNAQILYELKGTDFGRAILNDELKIPNFVKRYYLKKSGYIFFPTSSYKKFVKKLLENKYFVHFAGNYPIFKPDK